MRSGAAKSQSGLTERHQHGHGDDEQRHESVENLDGQLEGAALLAPHASAPAATWSGNTGKQYSERAKSRPEGGALKLDGARASKSRFHLGTTAFPPRR